MKKQLKHELGGVLTMIMEEEADWKQWVKNSRTGEERLEREEEVKIALNALHLLRCKVRNRIDELNVPEPEED